jgi:hypothetical protein
MGPDNALDHRRDLAIAVLVLIGLSLTILAGATAVRMLSGDWSAACRRLLRAPAAPGFAGPWRLADLHGQKPCVRRLP